MILFRSSQKLQYQMVSSNVMFCRRITLCLLSLFRGMKKWYEDLIQEGIHQTAAFCAQLHARVFLLSTCTFCCSSISKCFQRKSKFQLPYLLDRQTKAQSDKNDSYSLALQVSCKIRSRTRDTWLPTSVFIKCPSMPHVLLCYSLQDLLATFKIEVRDSGFF